MFQPLLLATTEAAAENGEEISPILAPYPGLMFWTVVAFFISMWVLKRFAFGPIQDALQRRRDTINGEIERSERLRDESQQLLDRYEAQLAGARAESEAIVERARTAGDDLTRRVKEEVEAQRQEQLAQTRAQVTAEVEKAMEDLRGALADMTVQASERVLRATLDDARHRELAEQAVADLDMERLHKVGAGS